MFAYRMKPFFRHGKDTPWGGDGLRRYFHKEIPDEQTGESLEASTFCDPETHTGESRAEDGRRLSEVAGRKLPLMLKLIDARETLSVQAHPDDAYAMRYENGKRGKTEAWVILRAEPGAKIVYGFKEGADIGSSASDNIFHAINRCTAEGGEAQENPSAREKIESSLRWVPVKPGDVFYVPAGMVHAIGAGILLYEIQQASDVTYRLWDWGRLGADGKPRTLHIKQACEVARHFPFGGPVQGVRENCAGGLVTHYLDTERFWLKRFFVDGQMSFPEGPGFAFLTALCEGSLLYSGDEVPFRNGDTLFIPECRRGIEILARGELLCSGETKGTLEALPPNP